MYKKRVASISVGQVSDVVSLVRQLDSAETREYAFVLCTRAFQTLNLSDVVDVLFRLVGRFDTK